LLWSAALSVSLAAIAVHYLEERMLPVVESVRLAIYGEQSYSSALAGCSQIQASHGWIHPTALALTVYGEAQHAPGDAFGAHEPEVLPRYARERAGLEELRCVADHFLASGEIVTIGSRRVRVFRFAQPYGTYGLGAGWVSGLTQGMVGQTLLAAYLAFGDGKYLDGAREAGALLAVDIGRGGARIELPEGAIWFEEYAQPGVRPPMVLNGHLLALDFLYWMQKQEPGGEWDDLFDAGMRAVVGQIDKFLSFAWSYYDQEPNLATRIYQAFHVRLLSRYGRHDGSGALARAGDALAATGAFRYFPAFPCATVSPADFPGCVVRDRILSVDLPDMQQVADAACALIAATLGPAGGPMRGSGGRA
jgi:hypothetical protein